jgi:hypothetical protein
MVIGKIMKESDEQIDGIALQLMGNLGMIMG